MKVLLINTSENTGGAAIACSRLMSALKNNGVNVKLLVKKKISNNPDIIGVEQNTIQRYLGLFKFVWERFIIFINNHFSKKIFSQYRLQILDLIWFYVKKFERLISSIFIG